MSDEFSRVYVIQRSDGLVKIGHASPFLRRFEQLERQYGELKLLRLIDGGRTEERWLHRKYADARIGKSEWFDSDELAASALADTLMDRSGGLCKFARHVAKADNTSPERIR